MTSTSRPVGKGDHIFLVDGSSFIFRAYFQSMNQDRKYNYRSDGLPTGAIRLFATKLMQFVKDGADGIIPTHLAIIFDKSENSFRKELYPPYKSNRSDPPEDLIPQFPLMREAVRAFGLFPVEQDRYEADDLIATYARIAVGRGADVTIVSADKDLMQLIKPGVSMYDPASGRREEQDLPAGAAHRTRGGRSPISASSPRKSSTCRRLPGDSTDNVPGVRGIGIKTAAQLLSEYGDLETLLARAGEIKQPKRREALLENAELARISKKLVTLVDDVSLETPLDDFALRPPPAVSLLAFLKAMEFTTITRRVAELYGVDANEVEPDVRLKIGGSADPRALMPVDHGRSPNGALPAGMAQACRRCLEARPSPSSGALAEARASGPRALRQPRSRPSGRPRPRKARSNPAAYETVTGLDPLGAFIAAATEAGLVALHTETSSPDPMQAELIGISLAIAPGRACYIPLAHRAEGADGGLFAGGLAPGQIEARAALERLKPLLEDASVLKIGHNLKYDWLVLAQHGIEVAPCDDTMLMSYVLDAGRGNHGIDDLAERWLAHKRLRSRSSRTAKGRLRVGAAPDRARHAPCGRGGGHHFPFGAAVQAAPRRAAFEHGLRGARASARARCSARMERRGIAIDPQILSRLSGQFAQGMARLEGDRSTRSPARASTSARPSNWATSCSARWGCPAAPRRRQAPGRPRHARSMTLPSRAMSCRSAFSNGASSPS